MSRSTKSSLLWTILLAPPLLVLVGAGAVSLWPREVVGVLNRFVDLWAPPSQPPARNRHQHPGGASRSRPSALMPQVDYFLLQPDGSPYQGSVHIETRSGNLEVFKQALTGPQIRMDQPMEKTHIVILTDGHAPTVLQPPHQPPADHDASEPMVVTLDSGFPHRIQVVDAKSRPIPSARVQASLTILDKPVRLNKIGLTDEEGWVTFPHLADADYEFDVKVHEFAIPDETVFVHPSPGVDTTIALDRDELEGVVVDEDDQPIADAVLLLVAEYDSSSRFVHTHRFQRIVLGTSNADGRFRLRNLHQASIHLIQAQAVDGGFGFASNIRVDRPNPVVTIHPKRMVEGLFQPIPTPPFPMHPVLQYDLRIDSPMEPVSDAQTLLHFFLPLTCTKEGRFEVPVWPSIEGYVSAETLRTPVVWPPSENPLVLSVPTDPTPATEQRLRFHVSSASSNSQPVSGLMTLQTGTGSTESSRQVEIQNGEGELTTRNGEVLHYDSSAIPGYWTEPGIMDLNGASVKVHASGTIVGRVSNADGTPARNDVLITTRAQAKLMQAGSTDQESLTPRRDSLFPGMIINSLALSPKVDDDGRFEISSWPLDFGCRLTVNHGFWYADSDLVGPDAQEPHCQVELQLPEPRSVEILAIAPDGHPLADILIMVSLEIAPDRVRSWRGGTTDADGKLTLDKLARGDYRYRLAADVENGAFSSQVELAPDQTNIVLQPSLGRRLEGRVVEAISGWPVHQQLIVARRAADGETLAATASDEEGRFHFVSLPNELLEVSSRSSGLFSPPVSVEPDHDPNSPILVQVLHADEQHVKPPARPTNDITPPEADAPHAGPLSPTGSAKPASDG